MTTPSGTAEALQVTLQDAAAEWSLAEVNLSSARAALGVVEEAIGMELDRLDREGGRSAIGRQLLQHRAEAWGALHPAIEAERAARGRLLAAARSVA